MIFEDNSKSVEKELAILLGRVSHHIHPKIVKLIQSKNKELLYVFKSYCHHKLNYLDFFYEGSDCLFPGVRRPINKEKGVKWKNIINQSDGTIFNDNTYPRHIWAFLTTQKAYSSKTWIESGLNAFELAHVFGHKMDEQELEKKVFKYFDNDFNPYALFTSASNIVLIPKGLTKPTDKMESIKLCFYKRHIELYGQNFKGIKGFKEELLPNWYSQIEWLDPILPINWEENIQKLINYRNNHLRNKYKKFSGINPSIRLQSASTSEIKNNVGLKVGDFVKYKMEELINNDLLSDKEIINLQRKDYSREKLHIQYPLLRKVLPNDPNKIDRYWVKKYIIKGKKYLICSEWYENPNNNDKTHFLNWYRKIVKTIPFNEIQ